VSATTILRDVRITMRDGVQLSADIWIPAAGKAPTMS
jgi:predicted acyl esterase